jgi:hypothetical protein
MVRRDAVSAMLDWTPGSRASGPTTATQRSVFSSNCWMPTTTVPSTTSTHERTTSTQAAIVRDLEVRPDVAATGTGAVPMR